MQSFLRSCSIQSSAPSPPPLPRSHFPIVGITGPACSIRFPVVHRLLPSPAAAAAPLTAGLLFASPRNRSFPLRRDVAASSWRDSAVRAPGRSQLRCPIFTPDCSGVRRMGGAGFTGVSLVGECDASKPATTSPSTQQCCCCIESIPRRVLW